MSATSQILHSNASLGCRELRALEAEGWGFDDQGLRVGNGWLVWAHRAGEWRLLLLADPEEEPEKWRDQPAITAPRPEAGQQVPEGWVI